MEAVELYSKQYRNLTRSINCSVYYSIIYIMYIIYIITSINLMKPQNIFNYTTS